LPRKTWESVVSQKLRISFTTEASGARSVAQQPECGDRRLSPAVPDVR
jgi:hypothetical protein